MAIVTLTKTTTGVTRPARVALSWWSRWVAAWKLRVTAAQILAEEHQRKYADVYGLPRDFIRRKEE